MALFYGERKGGGSRRENSAEARISHYRRILAAHKTEGRKPNAGCLLMTSLRSGSAPETVRTYENRLLQIARFVSGSLEAKIEEFDWSALEAGHLRDILGEIKAENRSKHSAKSVCLIFKRVAGKAHDLGHLAAHIYEEIMAVDRGHVVHSPKRNVIAEETVKKVSEKLLARTDLKSARNGAIFALMVGCGLRRSEAAALNLEDINAAERRISVQGRANGRARSVYLGAALYPLLERWTDILAPAAKEHQPLFTRIGRDEAAGGEIIGLNRVTQQTIYNAVLWISENFSEDAPFTPEECRRTYETLLRSSGHSAGTVVAALGKYRASHTRSLTHEELKHVAESIAF